MSKQRPLKSRRPQGPRSGLPRTSNLFSLSTKLALGVSVVVFLLGYQPTPAFPPLKQSIVKADSAEQVQTVTSDALPFSFQLPHPGYISTHFSSYHPAIDIATGLGMPIHPIAPGTVIDTGYNFWGLGLTVTVDHGNGYQSLYAHMGKIYVRKDQTVSSEDFLGEVGMTGNTSGPHTHLELKKDGKYISAQPLLPTLSEIPRAFLAASSSAKPVTPTYSGGSYEGRPSTAKEKTDVKEAIKVTTPDITPVLEKTMLAPKATPTPITKIPLNF